jgi:hypothetical protein
LGEDSSNPNHIKGLLSFVEVLSDSTHPSMRGNPCSAEARSAVHNVDENHTKLELEENIEFRRIRLRLLYFAS